MQKGAPARSRFLHTFMEKFKWVSPSNVSASMIFGSLLEFERQRRLENTVHGGEVIVSTGFWSSNMSSHVLLCAGLDRFHPVSKSTARPGLRPRRHALS